MSGDASDKYKATSSKRLSTGGNSLYELLNIQKGATEDEIKKAYRKLALKFHPDKNRHDPTAGDKFKEINKANSVLMDQRKRQIYDKYGSFGLNVASQLGEDKAEFFLKFENPCVKALLVLVCLFTGCCYCCCCYCLFFCNFCCGKFSPKDTDVEAGFDNLEENEMPDNEAPALEIEATGNKNNGSSTSAP